jgi:hypothetical protein
MRVCTMSSARSPPPSDRLLWWRPWMTRSRDVCHSLAPPLRMGVSMGRLHRTAPPHQSGRRSNSGKRQRQQAYDSIIRRTEGLLSSSLSSSLRTVPSVTTLVCAHSMYSLVLSSSPTHTTSGSLLHPPALPTIEVDLVHVHRLIP